MLVIIVDPAPKAKKVASAKANGANKGNANAPTAAPIINPDAIATPATTFLLANGFQILSFASAST
jgi:hypothetical protein